MPAVSRSVPALDELDTVLGDGDMGGTLQLIFKAFATDAGALPEDLGAAFRKLALAISRTSGSSFSGVVMAALLDASRQTYGKTSLPWQDLGALLDSAVQAMIERGGGTLGDKSVLDGLHAVAQAIKGEPDCGIVALRAHEAACTSLQAFRGEPCRLGRARLAGARSIGHDDPGMSALAVLTAELSGSVASVPNR